MLISGNPCWGSHMKLVSGLFSSVNMAFKTYIRFYKYSGKYRKLVVRGKTAAIADYTWKCLWRLVLHFFGVAANKPPLSLTPDRAYGGIWSQSPSTYRYMGSVPRRKGRVGKYLLHRARIRLALGLPAPEDPPRSHRSGGCSGDRTVASPSGQSGLQIRFLFGRE